MIDAVIQRLKDQVTGLRDVDGALALSALIKSNALPHNTPCAYVVPEGLRGGAADVAANAFMQELFEDVAIVLAMRSNDRFGASGVEPLKALIDAVTSAIAGWSPADVTGVFTLASGRVLNVQGGGMAYQLTFRISDHLRIVSS